MFKKAKESLSFSRQKFYEFSLSRKKKISLFLLIFNLVLYFAIFSPLIQNKNSEFQKTMSFAGEKQVSKEIQFLSNEILIKVKKESKSKVKENSDTTGIRTIDEKKIKKRFKKLERLIPEGKKSKKDEDIFLWYLISLEGPGERIGGELNGKSKRVVSKNPKAIALLEAVAILQEDPDIEKAEPNFVFSLSQTDTTPPTVSITDPAPGATVSGFYTIKATATDNVGVARVEFYASIGGQTPLIATDTTYPYEAIWDTTQTSNGSAAVFAYAYDGVNNSATTRSDVIVNNIVSTPTIIPSLSPTLTPTTSPSVTSTPTPTSIPFPNDPYYHSTGSWGQSYPDMWGMRKINMEPVWQATSSASVIIADIDTGVDRNHEDLKDNMWINTAETPGNGVDDDNNGYIDDYYGWDWIENDGDPMDAHGHGTHMAGTLAATGNNGIGVAGMSWNSKIMALRFLGADGYGYADKAAAALIYAADMGARVSSNSYGGYGQSQVEDDAIRYGHNKGMVSVIAAANSNDDALNYSPASSDLALTIAASDYNDAKAYFSNWGEKIDVAAPGVEILSTRGSVNSMCTAPRTVGNYCHVSGTSMATPHVAGLAALILSKNPSLTPEAVRQIIRTSSVDLGAAGKDKDFGYGRIDANAAFNLANTPVLAPIITSPVSRTTINGTNAQIIGTADGVNFSSYKVEIGLGRLPAYWTTLVTSTTPVTNGVLSTIDTTTLTDGIYIIRLSTTDTNGKTYQFQIHDIEIDNFDAEIVTPLGYMAKGSIAVMGSAVVKNSLTLQNYTIEWGEGTNPISFTSNGITLANGGIQPIINGQLATFDTSQLTDGQQYTVRLTVLANNGLSVQKTTTSIVDKDIVNGWPKVIFQNTVENFGSPTAMADLDGDGSKEIVVAAADGKVYAYSKNGSTLPGFPFVVSAGYGFFWGANIDDIDKDGKKEIIAKASFDLARGGKLYIIKSDGTAYTGWPVPTINTYKSADGTPLIVDLDNDGTKEIVVTGDGNYKQITIHAYRLNGTEITGFPKTTPIEETLNNFGSLSATDMDKDGKVELAIGNANKFYLFDNQGNLLPGWPYVASSNVNFDSPGAFGDIDGNGNSELAAIGDDPATDQAYVYIWRKDGTLFTNYPQVPAGIQEFNNLSRLNSPSIADIDNDGKDEIVIGMEKVVVFDEQGITSFTTSVPGFNPPAIGDINGDGNVDFVSTWFYKLGIALNNGVSYWNRVFPWNENLYATFARPPITADLDNNGKMEFLTAHTNWNIYKGNTVVYLWEIPTPGTATKEWPIPLHDSQRSGNLNPYIVLPPTPTPTPLPTNTPTPAPSDTTPPTVSITSPLNNSKVSRNKTTIIKASASDTSGIARIEFYVNGALKCTDTTASYTCAWLVPSPRNVVYTLQAKAYDNFGNTGFANIKVTSK